MHLIAAHIVACTTLLVQMNEPGRWAGICREQAALSHDPTVRDLLLEMALEYEAIADRALGHSAIADVPDTLDGAADLRLRAYRK